MSQGSGDKNTYHTVTMGDFLATEDSVCYCLYTDDRDEDVNLASSHSHSVREETPPSPSLQRLFCVLLTLAWAMGVHRWGHKQEA